MLGAYFVKILFVFVSLLSGACTEAGTASPEDALVGSTPGDAAIKTMLGIDPAKPVDFIRWHLVLRNEGKTFVMSVRYGVGKPNTPDFEGGGEKRTFEGTVAVSKEGQREIHTFTSNKMTQPVSLIKLNDDLFHLLTSDKRLMAGDGGWSYSLSKNNTLHRPLPASVSFEYAASGMPAEMVFVGRTPCREIAKEYSWHVGDDCSKLKWKLTLFRDPRSGKPTTYELQRTLHRTEPLKGTWSLVNAINTDSKAVVIRLDPDKPDTSISFLVGDENVIFFLDREGRLYGGNADFSYTLNRRTD